MSGCRVPHALRGASHLILTVTPSATVTNGEEGGKGQGGMRVTVMRLHGHLGPLCACLCGTAGPACWRWVEEGLGGGIGAKSTAMGQAEGRFLCTVTQPATPPAWAERTARAGGGVGTGVFSSRCVISPRGFLETYFPTHSTLHLAMHVHSWKNKGATGRFQSAAGCSLSLGWVVSFTGQVTQPCGLPHTWSHRNSW